MTTTGSLTGSLGGTLVMAADGSYTYDPAQHPGPRDPHARGTHVETFSYTATDGHGDDRTLDAVTITVNM